MLNSNELGHLSDRNLLAHSRAYEALILANSAGLNLTNAEADAIKALNNSFETSLDDWDEAQIAEDSKGQAKKDRRRQVLDELRRQRNVVYADTSISDETLAGYGLPPRDRVQTDSPAPATAPFGLVDYARLKHLIHFRDSETPDRKAKPAGMQGCEIWRYTGNTPPVSDKDFDYLATDTDSPYTANYDLQDAGKKVYYLLRWLSKSGERGEWSETIEATVNG